MILRRKVRSRPTESGGRNEVPFYRRCGLHAALSWRHRLGAGLPDPAGPRRDRVLALRRDRHPRPVHRRQAQPDVGPAGRGGKPPRRQRQHRRGRGSHGPARRLHAAFRRADARHQRHAVARHGLRSGDELRSDHPGRDLAGGVPGVGGDAVPVGQRGDRLRQGQSRQAELLFGRQSARRHICPRCSSWTSPARRCSTCPTARCRRA